MKAFVYTKELKPKKVATIINVAEVHEDSERIYITTADGIEFQFNTHKVKTTIYQN